MEALSNTFRSLIKIAGKILFILGLVLNICMIFFGFWPSLIYVLIMLLGTGMVVLNKNTDTPQPSINTVRTSLNKLVSSVKKIDGKVIQSAFITAAVTVMAFLVLSVCILILGQGYFKKRNTISDCKEITAALNFYKENKNIYPPNLTILISNNPMRANWNKDDWGNPYQYKTANNGTTFILISSGKDGKPNTKDDIIFKN